MCGPQRLASSRRTRRGPVERRHQRNHVDAATTTAASVLLFAISIEHASLPSSSGPVKRVLAIRLGCRLLAVVAAACLLLHRRCNPLLGHPRLPPAGLPLAAAAAGQTPLKVHTPRPLPPPKAGGAHQHSPEAAPAAAQCSSPLSPGTAAAIAAAAPAAGPEADD